MCRQCELKPVYEFTNKRKVCSNCFVKYFQKKFLTTIRKFEMVRKGDVVDYKKGMNFREVVLEDLLFMFAQKGNVEVQKIPQSTPDQLTTSLTHYATQINASEIVRPPQKFHKLKFNKIAIASTIDSESNKFIHILFKGDAKELGGLKPVDKKIIKPLYLFLDEEVLLYAKIKKLKFKKQIEKEDKLSKFVDELETKHPEIKRAIMNTYLELDN